MAGIDINRGTEGVVLDFKDQEEIIHKAIDESFILSTAKVVDLPGAGAAYQRISSEPEAFWVGETDKKPVGKHGLEPKKMIGYTLAIIEPYSRQLLRDKKSLVDEMVASLPKALGKKYDETVLATAETDIRPFFNTFQNTNIKHVNIVPSGGIYQGMADAEIALNTEEYTATAWIMSYSVKGMLKTARDDNNRPYFMDPYEYDNAPIKYTKRVVRDATATEAKQVGIAGQWDKARAGIVEGVSIRFSEEATITINGEQVNLFEHNMFACRCEMEAGFMIDDFDAFVRLTQGEDPTSNKRTTNKK